MKILFTTESYYPIIDGGAIAQHRIVHGLMKHGHEVNVIAPGFNFKNKIEDDNGSLIYRVRGVTLPLYMNNKYHFSPFPLLQVDKIIRKTKPDIINVCSPYPISVSALISARKHGIPVVGSIHILPENILAPILHSQIYKILRKRIWWWLVYFYNMVDYVTVPSCSGAELYKMKGLKKPIRVISNGVDTSVFSPLRNGEKLRKKLRLPDTSIVLYTGRINQEKNVDVLIRAVPRVVDKVDAHFLICGSGGMKKDIIRLADSLGINDYITFIDFLDYEEYPDVYALSDVFVMPGESELQSIVTLEAIASGLPVVVVNKGAVPELAKYDNGLLFEPGESEQLADNIISILSNPDKKKSMSKNSLKLAETHNINNVIREYENTYRIVLETCNKKRDAG